MITANTGKINCCKGFTLIEMIIVTSLTSLLTLVICTLIVTSFKAYRQGRQTIESQERVARVMREFEFSARATTDVEAADAAEFAFLRYYDSGTPYPTKVRYFIDGDQFKVGKTEPSGTAPNITYSEGDEQIDFLVSDVENTDALFTYYGSDGQELNEPINIASIRMIGLSISVDKNGDNPPAAVTEITKVTLRNKKTNL